MCCVVGGASTLHAACRARGILGSNDDAGEQKPRAVHNTRTNTHTSANIHAHAHTHTPVLCTCNVYARALSNIILGTQLLLSFLLQVFHTHTGASYAMRVCACACACVCVHACICACVCVRACVRVCTLITSLYVWSATLLSSQAFYSLILNAHRCSVCGSCTCLTMPMPTQTRYESQRHHGYSIPSRRLGS